MSNYFYDGQIRRFVSQFIKMVSNFEVAIGEDGQGVTVTQRVPVIYGDPSRQAAQIIRNNSENALNTVPAMAVYINGLTYDRDRVQEPNLVQKVNVRTRQFDEVTGTYTQQQGDAYTIERLMPVPYKLTLKLDIWTSSTEQKLQLLEQLSQLFNPDIEIQNTDNYVDWGSLSYAMLTDTSWTSRSVPTGSEEPIDIASMTFELPIWISSSAKVKKLGVIHQTINNLGNLPEGFLGNRIISLLNYGVILNAGTGDTYNLKLVKSSEVRADDRYVAFSPGNYTWAPLLEQYGRFISGITEVRLSQPSGSEIVGTVATNPLDPYSLIYTPFPDTLPANTLAPVAAIIDPERIDVDSNLISPATGTRYLMTQAVGSLDNIEGAVAWRGENGYELVCNANDIIEYTGEHWQVSFDSAQESSIQYATNLNTGIQYQWINQQWIKSFEGTYPGGTWSIGI